MDQLNKNNVSYISYILNLRRSKAAYIILLLAILPRVIWITRDVLPDSSIFQINVKLALDTFVNNLDLYKLNSIKVLSVVWIFLVISVFEFSKSRNLNKISLLRVNSSEGSKFADLIYFLLHMFGFRFKYLYLFATFGVSRFSDNFREFLNVIYEKIIPINLFSNGFTLFLVFIIGLLIFELGEYVGHRVSHGFLWDLHEFHHSATEMTILNVNRGSIIEGTIISFFSLPLTLLAVSIINQSIEQGQWIIFILWTIFGILGECFGYIGHSSLRLTFPKPLSLIFLSPSLHWIHHSDNPKHFNKNFGRILCIWDRVFGTYLDESNLKDIKKFGVENSQYNKHNPFYCYYILPLKKIYGKLKLIFI